MISVKTQQFESIKELLLRSRCDLAVFSNTQGAGFGMRAGLPLGAWPCENDSPELLLSFHEAESALSVSCRFHVGFDENGVGEASASDTLYTSFVNSNWPETHSVESGMNGKIGANGKKLIEIDAASFMAVLKDGPDAAGIPYFFNAFSLPSLSVNSIFLIGDFSDNLALRLDKGAFGKCLATPLLRV